MDVDDKPGVAGLQESNFESVPHDRGHIVHESE